MAGCTRAQVLIQYVRGTSFSSTKFTNHGDATTRRPSVSWVDGKLGGDVKAHLSIEIFYMVEVIESSNLVVHFVVARLAHHDDIELGLLTGESHRLW